MSPQLFAFHPGSESWPGLAKLNEEAGEVIQVIGKIMATGGAEEHWDGTNLRRRLETEIGDLMAAISFVGLHCNLDQDAIGKRMTLKLALYEQWAKEDK